MEGDTSSPKKRWINTKQGKGFVAGFFMPIVCTISSQIWSPIEGDNYRLFMLGWLGTFVLIFIFFQAILKRFGFDGFDVIEKGSLGENSAYVSFFAGVAFGTLVFITGAFIGTFLYYELLGFE